MTLMTYNERLEGTGRFSGRAGVQCGSLKPGMAGYKALVAFYIQALRFSQK